MLCLVILHSKCHELLTKYEDIIQHLSGSTLCFVEENSNLKLHSISDIVGDHTEIHLLLKVMYQYTYTCFVYLILTMYNYTINILMMIII